MFRQRDVPAVTADEAAEMMAAGALLVDVRDHDEWDDERIPGAVHHPMGAIDDWWEHLPRDRAVIVQCHTGARSARVVQALTGRGGMDNVHNLTGGIVAWAAAHHPTEPGS